MPRLNISVTSWYLLSISPRPSFMNPVTWSALSHESLIGPLSELVDAQPNKAPLYLNADGVRSKLIEIFNDPRLYVHARRVHDTSVNAIYEQAEKASQVAIFMRGHKNPDINTLANIKYSSNGSNPTPQSTILTNVMLSSDTLEDLYSAIPCPSNETLDERVADGTFVGYGTGCSERMGFGGPVSLDRPLDYYNRLYQQACRSYLKPAQ
ncbi:hypothetical protein EDB86DRAFT_3073415 [Lactarius hatsudake]|nr:hypothetical protein EDB86DRAFT_3073415 [Lactarius hatsudake]